MHVYLNKLTTRFSEQSHCNLPRIHSTLKQVGDLLPCEYWFSSNQHLVWYVTLASDALKSPCFTSHFQCCILKISTLKISIVTFTPTLYSVCLYIHCTVWTISFYKSLHEPDVAQFRKAAWVMLCLQWMLGSPLPVPCWKIPMEAQDMNINTLGGEDTTTKKNKAKTPNKQKNR